MPARTKKSLLEQRCPRNLYLSILVDVGVTYCRTLGESAARNFLKAQSIPENITQRVLSGNIERRQTDRERFGRPQPDSKPGSGHG